MKKQLLSFALLASMAVTQTNAYFKTITVTGDSFDYIQELYQQGKFWGEELIIDMKDCDPFLIRSAEAIKQYVEQLCILIGMKRFGDTVVVHFGEDEAVAGFSMLQLIETSLISGHFANATNTIYINIFSCKPYDPYKAAEFTREFFKGGECTMNVVLRK